VQQKLNAKNAAALDIAAACSGFIYGLELADALIAYGKDKTILVIGAEILTRITDYEDRATCVLLAMGRRSCAQTSDGKRGILGTYIKSDGSLNHLLYMDGGGTKYPTSYETIDKRMHFIKMAGREVFKYAVTAMGDAAETILKQTGLSANDVTLLIPHQANRRILDAHCQKSQYPAERVMVNIHKYGNTSAASIPIALDEARKEGRVKDGDIVVMVAFGAGLPGVQQLFDFESSVLICGDGHDSIYIPGQGSQYVGMGNDLYEAYSAVRKLYEKASEILEFDVAKVSFFGPEENLRQTKITQPAYLFIQSLSLIY